MGGTTLKREILGIALLLFAVFLGAAFAALALELMREGVSVKQSVGALGDLLAAPLVRAFGWPAAILIPFVPAVHALRLFGRLESRTDRSWMIFFAGMVLLLPVALALVLPAPSPGVASAGAGWWGGLRGGMVAQLVGTFGAWVSSRCRVGADGRDARVESDSRDCRSSAALACPAESSQSRRFLKRPPEKAPSERRLQRGGGDLALSLEPSPEEMPAIETSTPVTVVDDRPHGRATGKRRKIEGRSGGGSRREIVAAIESTAHPEVTGEELPSPELPRPFRRATATRANASSTRWASS